MRPVDTVIGRLSGHKVRENVPGRWRAICPVCGERNPNTLSIGEAESGAVLLKCFKEQCGVEAIASALGLDLADLFPPRSAPGNGSGPARKRRLLPAHQALQLLDEEMVLAVACMSDMAKGTALDDSTRERLVRGAAYVAMLRDEARS